MRKRWNRKTTCCFGVAVFVAALTAFYTFRLFFVVFFGKEKSKAASHAHESPLVMTLPLVALAVFAAIGGFIGIWNNYGSQFIAENETLSVAQQIAEPLKNIGPMLCGLAAAAVGIFVAFCALQKRHFGPAARQARRPGDGDEKQVLLRRTLRSHLHPRA